MEEGLSRLVIDPPFGSPENVTRPVKVLITALTERLAPMILSWRKRRQDTLFYFFFFVQPFLTAIIILETNPFIT